MHAKPEREPECRRVYQRSDSPFIPLSDELAMSSSDVRVCRARVAKSHSRRLLESCCNEKPIGTLSAGMNRGHNVLHRFVGLRRASIVIRPPCPYSDVCFIYLLSGSVLFIPSLASRSTHPLASATSIVLPGVVISISGEEQQGRCCQTLSTMSDAPADICSEVAPDISCISIKFGTNQLLACHV